MAGNASALRMGSTDERNGFVVIRQVRLVQVDLERPQHQTLIDCVVTQRQPTCQQNPLRQSSARAFVGKMRRHGAVIARAHVGQASHAMANKGHTNRVKRGRRTAQCGAQPGIRIIEPAGPLIILPFQTGRRRNP